MCFKLFKELENYKIPVLRLFVLFFLLVISLKILQMLCSFYVSGMKVFEEDHPLLAEHREKQLLLKRSLYQ